MGKLDMVAVVGLMVVAGVEGTCFCPSECITRSCDEHDVRTCDDYEAEAECMKANSEVSRMVGDMGNVVDLFLLNAGYKKMLDSERVSHLRTILSSVFEDPANKPVADCSAGLSTTTRLLQGRKGICYSPNIVTACQSVQAAYREYFINVHTRLAIAIRSDAVSTQYGFVNVHGFSSTVAEVIEIVKRSGLVAGSNNRILCTNPASAAAF